MLTKDYERTYTPYIAGSPAMPARAAYTVCQQSPAPGEWQHKCTTMYWEWQMGAASPIPARVAMPPGATYTMKHSTVERTVPIYSVDAYRNTYISGYKKALFYTVTYIICAPVWVTTGPPGPKVCTTYPATPAVPAVPPSPARVDVAPIHGWDAGANSVVSQAADCECVFTMQNVAGVVIGLFSAGDAAEVPGYQRLTHALYFAGRKFQVMESGAVRTAAESFGDNDEFRIRRAGGNVTYLRAGQVVFSSRVPSTGEVRVGSSLYSSGDYIK